MHRLQQWMMDKIKFPWTKIVMAVQLQVPFDCHVISGGIIFYYFPNVAVARTNYCKHNGKLMLGNVWKACKFKSLFHLGVTKTAMGCGISIMKGEERDLCIKL